MCCSGGRLLAEASVLVALLWYLYAPFLATIADFSLDVCILILSSDELATRNGVAGYTASG